MYEIFRCSVSKQPFIDQIKSDFNHAKDSVIGIFKSFSEAEELYIPPPIVEADGKPRRTLVINVQDVLLLNEWDTEHGSRYIRRPGVDKMLSYLCQFYEIFFVWPDAPADNLVILNGLDTYHVNRCTVVGNNLGKRNGKRCLDLAMLQREPGRVIILDKDASLYDSKDNVMLVKPFTSKNDVKDTTLLDLIPILDEIYMEDVGDTRDYIKQFADEDVVKGYREKQKQKEEEKKKERQNAFLQQINIFKQSEEDVDSTSNIILADPELSGVAPALAKNNIEEMISGGMMGPKNVASEDHLKYIPVEVNGDTPEGFTTYWQREYVRKKKELVENQERISKMQMIVMQQLYGEEDTAV